MWLPRLDVGKKKKKKERKKKPAPYDSPRLLHSHTPISWKGTSARGKNFDNSRNITLLFEAHRRAIALRLMQEPSLGIALVSLGETARKRIKKVRGNGRKRGHSISTWNMEVAASVGEVSF
jgi:hypothetical protein